MLENTQGLEGARVYEKKMLENTQGLEAVRV